MEARQPASFTLSREAKGMMMMSGRRMTTDCSLFQDVCFFTKSNPVPPFPPSLRRGAVNNYIHTLHAVLSLKKARRFFLQYHSLRTVVLDALALPI